MVAVAASDAVAIALPACPYRGIRPFRYADHEIFFARKEETLLLTNLVAVYRGVFLYGDSGSGKSSLVNAGLLPRAQELGFEPLLVRVQPRPGEEIVLGTPIVADDDGEPAVDADGAGAASEVLSIADFEERLRAAVADRRPLVVFDQFEEILTLFDDDDAVALRHALAEMIVRLLREQLPIKLVFAFREDYLGRVKQLLAACPELVDQALRLGPPSADALVPIIRGPFERFPGRFERELALALAEQLRGALAERFGTGEVSLSEVQTVCLRLWRSPDPELLLAEKGVQGLLEDELGEALDGFLPDVRVAAIALLSEMVTSAGTRNVISAEDLRQRVLEEDASIRPALLDDALERLERESRLVRRERRRDIYLYEITSEFLVPWISRRRDELRRAQERRADRRRLVVVGLIALAGVVVVALAVWAVAQSRDARQKEAQGTSFALALSGSSLLESQPDVALTLTLEASEVYPSADTRSAALTALEAAQPDGLLAILRGHGAAIGEVAISPDGRTLASVGGMTLRLWDVATRRPLGRPVGGHGDEVYHVAFSPDGRTVATGGGATVLLRNVRTRRLRARLASGGDTGAPLIAFSPDRRTLATADRSSIRLWDLRTNRRIASLRTAFGGMANKPALDGAPAVVAHVQSKQTRSLAFSPDGRLLAAAGPQTITLWDVAARKPSGPPLRAQPTTSINSVAFSPAGRTFASAGDDSIRLWSVRTRRRVGPRIPVQRGTVDSVAFTPRGHLLAAAGKGSVRLFDLRTGRQVGEPLIARGGVLANVAFSADGRLLVSAGADQRIRLWDVRRRVQLGERLGGTRRFDELRAAFSPDGHRLASEDGSGTIRLWDARTGKQLHATPAPSRDVSFGSLAYSADGRMIAAAGYDRIVLLDGRTGRLRGQIRRQLAGGQVALAPGAVAAAANNVVRIWDTSSLTERNAAGSLSNIGERSLSASADFETRLAFSPDGRTLALGRQSGDVELWDTRSDKRLGDVLRGHRAAVQALRFSRDGRTLASSDAAKSIRLWDVERRAQLGGPIVLPTSNDYVLDIAFSPDGRTLASADDDFMIRLWDVPTHKRLGSALPFAGDHLAMSFMSDGRTLATYDDSRTLATRRLLWRDEEDLRTEVCKLVGSGLSRIEWAQYAAGVPYRNSCR